MEKSVIQKVVENGGFIIAIMLSIFGAIDGLSSAKDFLTIRVSFILTCTIITFVIILSFYLIKYPLNWIHKDKKYKFVGLKGKFFISIIAILGSVWIPHIFKDNKATFSANIKISTPFLPQYPMLEKPNFQIWDNNSWISANLVDGDFIVFDQLSYKLKGKAVKIKMKANWWKSVSDTIILDSEVQLKVEPDGSLERLEGKVINMDEKFPLEGVLLEVDGEKDTTDLNGNFSIRMPMNKQKEEYFLSVIKNGYNSTHQTVYPASSKIEIRLDKSNSLKN